jgi:hypothetical protein
VEPLEGVIHGPLEKKAFPIIVRTAALFQIRSTKEKPGFTLRFDMASNLIPKVGRLGLPASLSFTKVRLKKESQKRDEIV